MANELVFDIGYHKGEDTRYYLSKGYRVVAVEANPLLAKQGQTELASYIASGQLTLLNVGIAETTGNLQFWINHKYSEWSSFHQDIGCRNGTACHAVNVDTITMGDLIGKYGVPYYLKIDIEGNDIYCLTGLKQGQIPKYVSCEACHLEWLTVMKEKGYTKFKLINQLDGFHPYNIGWEKSTLRVLRNKVRWRIIKMLGNKTKHPVGSSGPFGEETEGEWLTYDELVAQYKSFYSRDAKGSPLNLHSWYDFHGSY